MSGNDFNFSELDELASYRQADILEFIGNFIAAHGYSPSFREIMKGCGFNSTSSVAHHLSHMRIQGQVEYTDNIARSVRVTA